MDLAIENLTVPSEGYSAQELLRNWHWLIPHGLEFVMITRLGDAFLIEPQSGEIFFLDTLDGEFETIADSIQDFKKLLEDQDFVYDYFSLDLAIPLMQQKLAEGTVFSFIKPPVLGGDFEPSNLEPMPLPEHFDSLGQLWFQVDEIRREIEEEEVQSDSPEASA